MVFEGNNKIRRKIYLVIDGLTDDEFNKIPSTGGWSPKQILEHLTLMETYIAANVSRELKNPASPRVSKKILILPGSPMVKGSIPKETMPSDNYKTISELKVELHNSRIYLLDVYDGSCKESLKVKSFEHPNLGSIPLFQWFPFVGLYEKCHLKRLKKTIDELLMDETRLEVRNSVK